MVTLADLAFEKEGTLFIMYLDVSVAYVTMVSTSRKYEITTNNKSQNVMIIA